MKKKVLGAVLFSFLFASCTNDSSDDLIIANEEIEIITYTKNVKSIIDQSCATSGCHNANAGGLILETFNQVKNAVLNRNLVGRMESSSSPMPASGNLPQSTINIIKTWQEEGFLE
jgi:hypothetical protein